MNRRTEFVTRGSARPWAAQGGLRCVWPGHGAGTRAARRYRCTCMLTRTHRYSHRQPCSIQYYHRSLTCVLHIVAVFVLEGDVGGFNSRRESIVESEDHKPRRRSTDGGIVCNLTLQSLRALDILAKGRIEHTSVGQCTTDLSIQGAAPVWLACMNRSGVWVLGSICQSMVCMYAGWALINGCF